MAYLDATGLQIKTIEEILAELSAQQKADLDANLNTAADEPIGQLNGIIAAQIRELWEAVAVAYNGFNPDAAEGFLLEKLSALTGTAREGATKGTVDLTCNLDIGTTLVAGTHYAAVSGEPTNRWTPVDDFTAPSTGNHSVECEAENAGTINANAGTITVISTSLTGWNSVTNALDAEPGKEIDTDAELRTRRENELRATGTGTVDAIRADVLADPGVLQVSVFENTDNTPDANGLPPHSIEVVVFDGDTPALTDDEVAQLIWDTKPAGIATYGTSSGTATDSVGDSHGVNFSRPTVKDVYVTLDIKIDSVTGYAGSAALKDLLVDLNDTDLLLGRDVIAAKLGAVALGMPGVFDLTADPKLDFTASPTATANLVISVRELARLDTSRITINETFTVRP